MKKVFDSNRFFPQNFLIISDATESIENQIDTICSEAFSISPNSFNGECKCFKFILRYCPPYEQDRFRELKRLQEVARDNTRFKYEYKGFIAIDISEWAGHLNEELFSVITMTFLSDMSDCWKYIFINDKSNFNKDDMRVISKFFKVKQLDALQLMESDCCHQFFESIRNRSGIRFTDTAADILRRFMPKEVMKKKDAVLALGRDFNNYFGKNCTVSKEMLLAYLIDPDSICYDFLTEMTIDEIHSIIEEGQRI